MAAKKPAAKRRAEKRVTGEQERYEKAQADAPPVVDESDERNRKVDELQGVERAPEPLDGPTEDESQERNEKVSDIVASADVEPASEHSDGLPVDNRTTRDGAAEDEDVDLPVVRVGELWESMDARDDDVSGGRRRVRVVDTDEDGKVRVENLVTKRVSHIDRERFQPPHWNRQFS